MMRLNGIRVPVTGTAPLMEETAKKWTELGQPVFDGMTTLGEYLKDAKPKCIVEGKDGFIQVTFKRVLVKEENHELK